MVHVLLYSSGLCRTIYDEISGWKGRLGDYLSPRKCFICEVGVYGSRVKQGRTKLFLISCDKDLRGHGINQHILWDTPKIFLTRAFLQSKPHQSMPEQAACLARLRMCFVSVVHEDEGVTNKSAHACSSCDIGYWVDDSPPCAGSQYSQFYP
jgi:hypothetical protein